MLSMVRAAAVRSRCLASACPGRVEIEESKARLESFRSRCALTTAFSFESKRSFDRREKLGILDRFRQKRYRTGSLAPLAHPDFIMGSNDDGGNSNTFACEILLQFQSGHLRHLQIEDEAIRRSVSERREG